MVSKSWRNILPKPGVCGRTFISTLSGYSVLWSFIGEDAIAPDAGLSPLFSWPRKPLDSCVQYIASEFDLAANDLPDVTQAPTREEYSKSVMMAYKAQLY